MFRGGLKVGEIFITEGDQLEQLKKPQRLNIPCNQRSSTDLFKNIVILVSAEHCLLYVLNLCIYFTVVKYTVM